MIPLDNRRLIDNVMSISVTGALLGYLGRLTLDWLGVIIALVIVFAALLWAVHDARVES